MQLAVANLTKFSLVKTIVSYSLFTIFTEYLLFRHGNSPSNSAEWRGHNLGNDNRSKNQKRLENLNIIGERQMTSQSSCFFIRVAVSFTPGRAVKKEEIIFVQSPA